MSSGPATADGARRSRPPPVSSAPIPASSSHRATFAKTATTGRSSGAVALQLSSPPATADGALRSLLDTAKSLLDTTCDVSSSAARDATAFRDGTAPAGRSTACTKTGAFSPTTDGESHTSCPGASPLRAPFAAREVDTTDGAACCRRVPTDMSPATAPETRYEASDANGPAAPLAAVVGGEPAGHSALGPSGVAAAPSQSPPLAAATGAAAAASSGARSGDSVIVVARRCIGERRKTGSEPTKNAPPTSPTDVDRRVRPAPHDSVGTRATTVCRR